jgi:hypothetical protein
MPSPLITVAAARTAQRLPGLRRLPLARLVILTELAILAKTHLDRLTPAERRRLLELLAQARGWPRNLSGRNGREFEKLVSKLEPRLFAHTAVEKFAPTGNGRRDS